MMSSAQWKINFAEVEALQNAMANYSGNTEEAINSVLHRDGGLLIRDSIRQLIPVSDVTWKGKRPAAKKSKSSLKNVNENLSVTVKSNGYYHYLYFPDDGTTTKRHVGNQQFFARGGEAVQDEIIERCINKLVNTFEEGV